MKTGNAASPFGNSPWLLRAEGADTQLLGVGGWAEELPKQLTFGPKSEHHSFPDSAVLRMRTRLVMQRQGRVQLEHPRLIRAQQASWIPYQAAVDMFTGSAAPLLALLCACLSPSLYATDVSFANPGRLHAAELQLPSRASHSTLQEWAANAACCH